MLAILRRYYRLIVFTVMMVTLLFFFQYLYSSRVVREQAESNLQQEITLASLQIGNWMERNARVIENAAVNIPFSDSPGEMLEYLKIRMGMNPDFRSLYFLTVENQMVNASGFVPPPEIDFRLRPLVYPGTSGRCTGLHGTISECHPG